MDSTLMADLKTQLARAKKKVLLAAYQASDRFTDSDRALRYHNTINGFHNADYRFKKDEIMFVHLPKTGGTSLSALLENDPQSRFPHLHIHRPVSVHCPPSEFKYLTVMRNPIDRVWSQYQMVLREGPNYPYNRFAQRGLPVFLEKFWGVSNAAVQYYCGKPFVKADRRMLQQAQTNLEAFYRVLPFDQLPEQAAAFLNAHQVPHDEIPNLRKARYEAPTPEAAALIAKFNQLDIELWENWESRLNPKL